MRLVVVESPYAGRPSARIPRGFRWLAARWLRRQNVRYARAAVRDCLLRGEAPIASHLLYTQPGILRDDVPSERWDGIEAGLAWGCVAAASVFYVDRGWTPGMCQGEARARAEGRSVVVRMLGPPRRFPDGQKEE